jgi:subtilisin family serine protease
MSLAHVFKHKNSRRMAGFVTGLALSFILCVLRPSSLITVAATSGRPTVQASAEPIVHASAKKLATDRPRPRPTVEPRNWGLQEIETSEAWRLSRGHRDVLVAVIDTGIDRDHPALRDHLWTNPGESGLDARGRDKGSNGIDDDGNGYVDDVHGWNFVSQSNDLTDRHGHGTHIAGIVSSVAPEARVMVLKYYDPRIQGSKALANTIEAIHYAVKMGAVIINYSGGGMERSPLEEDAIRLAAAQGILLVAAAGNESANSDFEHYYPADYRLSNILSVTAIDSSRTVLDSSNYGEGSVDLAAPGADILSTLPGGGYGMMTGTSQATAFATGAAALLKAHKPQLDTPEKLIRHLVNTGLRDVNLEGKTRARTVLNSYRALAMDERAPVVDDSAEGAEALSELAILEPENEMRAGSSH